MTRYHVGGFSGQIIPMVGVTFSIPDPLVSSARGISLHKKIAKKAATVVMQDHHFNRMPGHFRQTNRNKYDHMERKRTTKRRKRRTFGSITDLVKSGQTRDSFLGSYPTVHFSGNPSDTLKSFLRYRWPFPVNRDETRDGVTVDQMEKELDTWTFQELADAIELFRDVYAKEWEDEMARRPRWRKKIEPKLATI